MKKIIITGATGFIGRNFAESLHGKGYEVIASGRSEAVGKLLTKWGISFRKADILSGPELDVAFEPADCLIHCAAKAGDWGNYTEFYETNVMGTRNVIQACKKHGIKRIIFISTPSVYFSGEDRLHVREDEPLPDRQFHYGKTKLMAEKELLELTGEGFQTIILRPRAVYGKYDNTILPRILRLSEKSKIPMIRGGKALVDITYIDNLTAVVENCFSADEGSWNHIYNISNGDPVTLSRWFEIVLDIFNRPFNPRYVSPGLAKVVAFIQELKSKLPFADKQPSMTRFSVGYMANSMTMSIDKAKEKLGYAPKISNKQGFLAYKDWFIQENP